MNDIRWQQRFDNFDRAFILLREVQERGVASLSQMEKEGAIQRFELAFELAWKTLKDYLEAQGIVFQEATPRKVIKEAFAVGILDDAGIWLEMLLQRNLLSHTYDSKVFEAVLQAFENNYFACFDRLHDFLMTKTMET
ncbi:MAG: nucleotidyltransferase substrate binding protein [Magnetococcales bacterium]|nr:nucleotidyltransferase substrate binding protein [Magnetococcales bacterium]